METRVSRCETEARLNLRPDFGRLGMKPHKEYILDPRLDTAHHTVFDINGSREKVGKSKCSRIMVSVLDHCSSSFKVFVSDS